MGNGAWWRTRYSVATRYLNLNRKLQCDFPGPFCIDGSVSSKLYLSCDIGILPVGMLLSQWRGNRTKKP